MSEGAKYKLILKALEVAHAPKNVTSVVLKATCNRKAKETGKAAVSGGAATWDTDNTLAKLSLRTRDKEPCELVLVNVRKRGKGLRNHSRPALAPAVPQSHTALSW